MPVTLLQIQLHQLALFLCNFFSLWSHDFVVLFFPSATSYEVHAGENKLFHFYILCQSDGSEICFNLCDKCACDQVAFNRCQFQHTRHFSMSHVFSHSRHAEEVSSLCILSITRWMTFAPIDRSVLVSKPFDHLGEVCLGIK